MRHASPNASNYPNLSAGVIGRHHPLAVPLPGSTGNNPKPNQLKLVTIKFKTKNYNPL
jgi:hypothetical protein